jgi:PAS domain S-box-containing protein
VGGLTTTIFILDLFIPLGFAIWLLYFVPVWFTLRPHWQRLSLVHAALCSLLILAGFYGSPPGSPIDMAMVNRSMGVAMLWGVVLLGLRRQQAEDALLSAHHELERRVQERTTDLIHTHQVLQEEVLERQLAVEGWRESREQFTSAFHDAAIGMALVGTDGQWLQVNRALCDIVGFSEQELLATNFQAITHPDDLETDLVYVKQLLAGEVPTYQMEKRYIHKLGFIVWIQLSVSLVRDVDSRPLHFISQIQNVTDRNRVAAELRESQARLQAILDHSPTLIFLKDTEGRYLLVNRQFETAFHLASKDIVGKTDAEIFSPEQAAAFRVNDNKVLQAGTPLQFEEVALEDDGLHTSIVFKFPLCTMDGHPYALCGITTDITKRKQAEEALRQSEARYRQLIELSQDAIYVFDNRGTFTMSNPAGCTLLGYTEQELVGLSWANTYRAEDRPDIDERLQRLRTGGQLRFERIAVRKNGTTVPIEVCLSPMTHGHYQAVVRDITERKRVEDELLALKDGLAIELMAMNRLHEFSTRLVASTELQPLLEEVLHATIALQDADFGNVQLYNPQTQALEIVAHRGFRPDFLEHFKNVHDSSAACGRALQQHERVIIEDVQTDPRFEPHRPIAASAGFRAVQSTPLFSRRGEALGMISTHFRQPHRPSERELRLTDLYARQAADMIEHKRDEEARRDSEQLLRRVLEEREHLSLDLHDNIIQTICAVGMGLEECQHLIHESPEAAGSHLRHAIAELNVVIHDVRRHLVGQDSEAPTSAEYVQRELTRLTETVEHTQGLHLRFHIEESALNRLSQEVAQQVMAITREAVSNSLRHSEASMVSVSLQEDGTTLHLTIEDNGVGFDCESQRSHGHGLRNIAARAQQLGGTLEVTAQPGQGTHILVHFPMESSHARI